MKFQKWEKNHWVTFESTLKEATEEITLDEFKNTVSRFSEILAVYYNNKVLYGLTSNDRNEIQQLPQKVKRVLRYKFNPVILYVY
jgi:hypothetical protein